jgi:hypothetical protein
MRAVHAVPVEAASIVPQIGIRRVRVGMTRTQVRARLGAPGKIVHGRNDFGRYTTYRYGGLVVTFQSDAGASSIATTARADRTIRNVGVGSTDDAVAARVAGARCVTESGFRHCYVGRWLPGRIITDFAIRRGHVTRVLVGRVLD